MYSNILEGAIAQIEAQRQQRISACRQQVMQEVIIPFHTEVDTSLRNAISELQQENTAKIAKVQQEFEANKNALTEAAAAKKKAFAEAKIAEAVAQINYEADEVITHLRKKIAKGE